MKYHDIHSCTFVQGIMTLKPSAVWNQGLSHGSLNLRIQRDDYTQILNNSSVMAHSAAEQCHWNDGDKTTNSGEIRAPHTSRRVMARVWKYRQEHRRKETSMSYSNFWQHMTGVMCFLSLGCTQLSVTQCEAAFPSVPAVASITSNKFLVHINENHAYNTF